MHTELEKQKLIDLCFRMALESTNDLKFCKKERGERMAWVANNLRELGFDTHPVGMSWGVLVSPIFRSHTPPILDNIDNISKSKSHPIKQKESLFKRIIRICKKN